MQDGSHRTLPLTAQAVQFALISPDDPSALPLHLHLPSCLDPAPLDPVFHGRPRHLKRLGQIRHPPLVGAQRHRRALGPART